LLGGEVVVPVGVVTLPRGGRDGGEVPLLDESDPKGDQAGLGPPEGTVTRGPSPLLVGGDPVGPPLPAGDAEVPAAEGPDPL
jgi:hypothetical protein